MDLLLHDGGLVCGFCLSGSNRLVNEPRIHKQRGRHEELELGNIYDQAEHTFEIKWRRSPHVFTPTPAHSVTEMLIDDRHCPLGATLCNLTYMPSL